MVSKIRTLLSKFSSRLAAAFSLLSTSPTDPAALRLSNAALVESERKYIEIIEQFGEGFSMVDPNGAVLLWNQAMEKISGLSSAEVIGNLYWEVVDRFVIPERRTPERLKHLKDTLVKALASGEWTAFKNPIEAAILRTDGQRRFIHQSTFIIHLKNGNYIGNIIRDITDTKRAEETLQKETQRSKALARLATRLNASLDLQEVLDTVCEEAASIMKSPVALIRTLDEGDQTLSIRAAWGLDPVSAARFQPLPVWQIEQYYTDNTNILVIPNLSELTDVANADIYLELGFNRIVICRLQLEGIFAGFLSIVNTGEIKEFSEDDLTLLQTLTNQIAVAIHNACLYETLKDGRERLRAMSEKLIDVQEAERRSLALELHDELGQMLSGIKISLDMIPRLPEEAAKEQLDIARKAAAEAIASIRKISLDLRPGILDEMGLEATLKWFFRTYQDQTQAPVEFHCWGLERRFPPRVEITVYRIVQEALTNIIRHSSDKQAWVDIWADERMLNLQIMDRGGGFDTRLFRAQGISTGLGGMRERARLMGGELVIESTEGAGTTISASLPLAQPES
jgi:PAS domain S-box-containing protein